MNRGNRIEVPQELSNLLLDFTVSVLLNKPEDLIEYASLYFARLSQEKKNQQASVPQQSSSQTVPASSASKSGKTTSFGNHLEDESEDNIDFEAPAKLSFSRRKSVFAEHYDPAEDEEEEKIIHPKSDEQRKRLGEAVKSILLFRSLDPVSNKYVKYEDEDAPWMSVFHFSFE